jgi:outer membrane biosynthesis protein TonB
MNWVRDHGPSQTIDHNISPQVNQTVWIGIGAGNMDATGKYNIIIDEAGSNMVVEDVPPADVVQVEREPQPVKKVAAEYPELAMRSGLEGRVVVKIWIDKEGKPNQVVVLQSDAEIFNEPAVEAAKQ